MTTRGPPLPTGCVRSPLAQPIACYDLLTIIVLSMMCINFFYLAAQLSISLARIEGQVGENVTFNCTSVDPGVGENIFLEVQNAQGGFDVFDGAGRLDQSSMGSVAFFSFGPLMSSDNGLVFRCRFAGSLSSNAVISVICK